MPTAIANGSNEAERKAAKDANEVQDGVNIIAIVGAFHRHLIAIRDAGVCGDRLNNHPVTIGGAAYFGVIQQTTPCSSEQSADLVTELRRIGYILRPIRRASRTHHDARRQLASDLRNTI